MTTRNAASMGTYGSTWESRGYSGVGPVESLIGTLDGRPAVICGNGYGVFEEFDQIRKLYDEKELVVFGVNDVGMYLDKLDHWVSLHADNLGAWKAVRWAMAKSGEKTLYHSATDRPFITHCWSNLTPCFALSGYFAMQIAWIMGCSRIILCGCPGMPMKRFFEAAPRGVFGYGGGDSNSDTGVREQVEKEMIRIPEFKKVVRSTRGWTRHFFGGI